MDEMQYYL